MKIGDKVSVIDSTQKGEIIEIVGLKAKIIDEHGFDDFFLLSKLTLQFSENEIEDTLTLASKIILQKEKLEQKPTSKKSIEREELIVDLHIHELVEKFGHLNNFEMLQIQMDKVKTVLSKAKKNTTKSITFIHGKGTGKLKQELEKYFKSKSYNFYPASLLKYGMGATTVEL